MYSRPRCLRQELSERFWACVRRELHTYCSITTWEKLTAHSVRGDFLVAELVRSPMRSQGQLVKPGQKFVRNLASSKSSCKMARPKAWCWRTVMNFTQTL